MKAKRARMLQGALLIACMGTGCSTIVQDKSDTIGVQTPGCPSGTSCTFSNKKGSWIVHPARPPMYNGRPRCFFRDSGVTRHRGRLAWNSPVPHLQRLGHERIRAAAASCLAVALQPRSRSTSSG